MNYTVTRWIFGEKESVLGTYTTYADAVQFLDTTQQALDFLTTNTKVTRLDETHLHLRNEGMEDVLIEITPMRTAS